MISIIIPTLNEIVALPSLLAVLTSETVEKEIILVDGGSDDGTWEEALSWTEHNPSVYALQSEPGRGKQLQVGVNKAEGDILFFLHADTSLQTGTLEAIQNAFTDNPMLIGGNFQLVFEGKRLFYRFMNHFYGWIRLFGLYYGDSGTFIRRSAYDALGGFRSLPIMEDYDLVRRMERYGRTCCIQEPVITTSTRRFEGKTPLQMFWLWGKMHVLYALGVSGTRLEKHYEGDRHALKI